MLVAVEGLDGVGKTSTAKELAKMIDGTYFSKGFHLMRDTTGKYDNFTSIAECIGTDFNIISEYGTRSTFLYCKQKNMISLQIDIFVRIMLLNQMIRQLKKLL